MSHHALVGAIVALFAFHSIAAAQVPDSLGFQGYLADSTGTPVDTSGISMTFKIYDFNTVEWSRTYSSVPVNNGVFSVNLGGNGLDSLRFNQLYHLGITVGGGSEMAPRTPLSGVAYAKALPGMHTFYARDDDSGDRGYNVVGGDPYNVIGAGVTNATISGGGGYQGNFPATNSVTKSFGTIGGGRDNDVDGIEGFIGGGSLNKVWGLRGVVAGGRFNDARNAYAAVGGGNANDATGPYSTIPGGNNNEAAGRYSFAAGNRAEALHGGTFVWADSSGSSDDFESTDQNQFLIRAKGGVGIGTNAPSAQLTVDGDVDFTGPVAIGDTVQRSSLTIRGPDNYQNGPSILLYGDGADQEESGRIRFVEGTSLGNYRGAYIAYDGTNGINSLTIGTHNSSDTLRSSDFDVITIERSTGDLGIKRSNPAYSLQVGTTTSDGNGAYVTDGGIWTNGSSRTFKEDLRPVDAASVLERVAGLPVYRWRYKNSDEGEHMGPVAEDFYASFQLGDSEKYIGGVDGDGVALAAIQGLYDLVKDLQAENARLRDAVERAGIQVDSP